MPDSGLTRAELTGARTLPVSARLKNAHSVLDLRQMARRRLPSFVFDFIEGGAEDEECLQRHRRAYARYRLVPRYLIDVRGRDTACTLFDRRWDAPIGISPTGLAGVVRPGADLARAAAAARANIPFVLSTASSERMEAVARVAEGTMWFQLYLLRDWSIAEDLVRRARQCGVDVLVLTVDVPVSSKRERDLRHGFRIPLRLGITGAIQIMRHPAWAMRMARSGSPTVANITHSLSANAGREAFMAEQSEAVMTWESLRRLRDLWPGTLVLKGLLSPHDVRLAAQHGVNAVFASNHGGRQLDSAPSPIEVLPSLVEAAAGRLDVLIDSGIMRGADIVKAVALGAKFAFIGKASLYGLAAGGQAGVQRALDILRQEVDLCLGQIGCRNIAEIGRHHIFRADADPEEQGFDIEQGEYRVGEAR